MGNLGTQKKIEQWETIDDLNHIRALATMHESLEWFAACMRRSLQQLPVSVAPLLFISLCESETWWC